MDEVGYHRHEEQHEHQPDRNTGLHALKFIGIAGERRTERPVGRHDGKAGGYDHLQPGNSAGDNTVKIGAVLPLTGDSAFLGEAMREMMLMAQADAKKETFKYQLIFEDTAFELSKTALATNKLIDVDKVDGVISLFGNWGQIAGTICQKKKTPHLNVAWEETQRIGNFNFNSTAHPTDEADIFAVHASQAKIATWLSCISTLLGSILALTVG